MKIIPKPGNGVYFKETFLGVVRRGGGDRPEEEVELRQSPLQLNEMTNKRSEKYAIGTYATRLKPFVWTNQMLSD